MAAPIVIDLSHWNTIPSSLVPAAQAGIIGVIHKASEGASYKDDKVDARYELSMSAGMMFGIYHFLRAGVSIDAQISNFLGVYNRYNNEDILVALDYEKGQDGKTPSISEVESWLTKIANHVGKKPVIYSGNSLKEALKGQKHPIVNGDNYPLWLAQYGSKAELPPGWSEYWLWQYTDKGSVAGVDPPTDLNTGDKNKVAKFWLGYAPPAPEPPPVGSLDFADALREVLDGGRARRSGWNGKGMWIALADVQVENGPPSPLVCMYTAQRTLVPWLCSVTDMTAYDWEVVE